MNQFEASENTIYLPCNDIQVGGLIELFIGQGLGPVISNPLIGTLKYNQKLYREKKWFLAIELPLFSRIMQIGYHLKEFRERNLTLVRIIKFCSPKGAVIKYGTEGAEGI